MTPNPFLLASLLLRKGLSGPIAHGSGNSKLKESVISLRTRRAGLITPALLFRFTRLPEPFIPWRMANHTRRTPAERKRLLTVIQAAVAKGATVAKACKAAKVSVANFYNWRGPTRAGTSPKTVKGSRVEKPATHLEARFSKGLPAGQLLIALGSAKDVQRALKSLAALTR